MSHFEISDSAPGRDTGPLRLDQLSDHELSTIIGIERHLYDASAVDTVVDGSSSDCLATVYDRHPRILLLDGIRGTGKTSLLLTLVDRWRRGSDAPAAWKKSYQERVERLRQSDEFAQGPHDAEIPPHVVPIRILDFDSLPPGVPLVAAVVQAWRPLATRYDELARQSTSFNDEEETLVDIWHHLFRLAAVGWAESAPKGGLIEQVLDREEQLDDWQRLAEQWRVFVNEVIKRGKSLNPPDRLAGNPVFVIVVDDVDLQVERIRDLLPALRLLYHPRVVFLVAGDQRHLAGMLTLDFLGQQNSLSGRRMVEDGVAAAEIDPWAAPLARAAIQKTFPLANRWTLRALSLGEVLAYPTAADNFRTRLDNLQQRPVAGSPAESNVGQYLSQFANASDEVSDLPPLMTYRTAQQVFRQTTTAHKDLAATGMDMLRYLIGGTNSDDIVRLTWRRRYEVEAETPAEAELGRPALGVAAVTATSRVAIVDYRVSGEIAALYRPDLSVPVSGQSEIILSARPEFTFRRTPTAVAESMRDNKGDTNATAALVATSLREDNYGIVAPGLQWNVRLALAWTRVRMFDRVHEDPNLDLAFQWRFHEHPSPKRLLEWTTVWSRFVQSLYKSSEQHLDRIAYAWIYYHLGAMGGGNSTLVKPLDESFNTDEAWDALLRQQPGRGTDIERQRWRTRTLPLLARPEVGLSPKVQSRLLSELSDENDETVVWLWDQRRRLVTDAILAAGDEAGVPALNAEDQARVDYAVSVFERRHKDTYRRSSSWADVVETRAKGVLPRISK